MSETGDFQNTSCLEKDSDYCLPAGIAASVTPAAQVAGEIQGISTTQANMAHHQEKQGQGTSLRIIFDKLKKYTFYHGEINRKQSESLLHGKPEGSFLIRYSKKPQTLGPDGYLINNSKLVLSLKQKVNKIKHIVINKGEGKDDTHEVRMFFLLTIPRTPSINAQSDQYRSKSWHWYEIPLNAHYWFGRQWSVLIGIGMNAAIPLNADHWLEVIGICICIVLHLSALENDPGSPKFHSSPVCIKKQIQVLEKYPCKEALFENIGNTGISCLSRPDLIFICDAIYGSLTIRAISMGVDWKKIQDAPHILFIFFCGPPPHIFSGGTLPHFIWFHNLWANLDNLKIWNAHFQVYLTEICNHGFPDVISMLSHYMSNPLNDDVGDIDEDSFLQYPVCEKGWVIFLLFTFKVCNGRLHIEKCNQPFWALLLGLDNPF